MVHKLYVLFIEWRYRRRSNRLIRRLVREVVAVHEARSHGGQP